MEVVPLPTGDDVARLAADTIERHARRGSATGTPAVLGLATGSSPLPAYRELIRRRRAGSSPSYEGVAWFTLDEYIGLPPGHEQSYRATIERDLLCGLGIPVDLLFTPDPTPEGLPDAGDRYEEEILAAGGIGLQVLGIGTDGHVAFNEPGSSLASLTRIKTLTEETRRDNARFFARPDKVPRHVLTQGLGTILRAKHLMLVATGKNKASAVAAAVEGPISASCPASILQMHPRATVLLDALAASQLVRNKHYRDVFAAKPEWQTL